MIQAQYAIAKQIERCCKARIRILREGHAIPKIGVSALRAGDGSKIIATDTIRDRDRDPRFCGNSGSSEKISARSFARHSRRIGHLIFSEANLWNKPGVRHI
jgi:hypothetical protein